MIKLINPLSFIIYMKDYHTKTKEAIFRELKTSEKGLTQQEAKKRLQERGLNVISKKKKKSQILLFGHWDLDIIW